MAWSNEFQTVYATRDEMVSASDVSKEGSKLRSGTIGVVLTELGNLYTYDASITKWIVHPFNKYTTSTMPDTPAKREGLYIPPYTKLVNTQTGEEVIETP